MAFQVSPGINISEIDLSTTVPALATTVGAIGGVFNWGPVGKFILVDSENTLAARYGKPQNNNYETYYTAANFLAYGNALYVSRAAVTSGGFSNTVAAASVNTVSGSTTVTLVGNTFGVATGQYIIGAGIPEDTYVTGVSYTGGNTTLTISNKATSDTDPQLNFVSNTYTLSAVANSDLVTLSTKIVKNADDFESKGATNTTFTNTQFVARYPGNIGNSLKVSVVDNANQYSRTIDMFSKSSVGYTPTSGDANTGVLSLLANAAFTIDVNSATANVILTWVSSAGTNSGNTANGTSLTYADTKLAAQGILNSLTVGDYIQVGNTTTGTQLMKIKSLPTTSSDDASTLAYFPITFDTTWNKATTFVSNTISRKWEYFNTVSTAPGVSSYQTSVGSTVTDQISIVVVDEDGKFSGTPGTVLEVYENLSRATDGKTTDGTADFYKTFINDNSRYIWATNDRVSGDTATAINLAATSSKTPYTKSFVGATDGCSESTITPSALGSAYDLFADPSSVDISLVLAGKAGGTTTYQMANYLIDNIAEVRKDCVVFISPDRASVVNNIGSEAASIVSFRNNVHNSSYAFIDSGYKYQYDKYSDVYRYIPLNGDIAGITARTDNLRDPWFSPAGYNRGQVKNLIKLAYSPSKADCDTLYKNGVNPVITQPGKGTVLFGDKTALGKTSAFDRINVRRLFIVLEKTIATAANQMLFEFNDEFTRAQFRNLVEPFLRDVQGRRGIYDFRVVCDETNNTPEVIDANQFVGDIYIKPAKSINYIQLNFVAVRTGVDFTEVVGQF